MAACIRLILILLIGLNGIRLKLYALRLCRNILDYLALVELIALLAGVHNQLLLVLVHLPARLGRFIRQIFRNFVYLLLHCAVLQRSVQRNIRPQTGSPVR